MASKNFALFAYLGKTYDTTNLAHFTNAYLNCTRLMAMLDPQKWHRDLLADELATRDAIHTSYLEIIRQAEPQSWLLFYFFGHGMTDYRYGTKNRYGDLQTYLITYSSALAGGVPYDEFKELFLLDEDLTDLTLKALAKGVYVCNIVDCCYGGGMVTLPTNTPNSANHVFLAAAQPQRTAILTVYDSSTSTKFYSALHPAATSAGTFSELRQKVDNAFTGMDKSETPVVMLDQDLSRGASVFRL